MLQTFALRRNGWL